MNKFKKGDRVKHYLLYVCTFGKEGSGKGHPVVSRRKENLETTEVSDARPIVIS